MGAIDYEEEKLIEKADEIVKLVLQKKAVHDYQNELINRPKRLTRELIKERERLWFEIEELIKEFNKTKWKIMERNRKKEWEWWK